jgi:glucan phosphoethanolaminetransferase (alkaline phosphatase superfamily)
MRKSNYLKMKRIVLLNQDSSVSNDNFQFNGGLVVVFIVGLLILMAWINKRIKERGYFLPKRVKEILPLISVTAAIIVMWLSSYYGNSNETSSSMRKMKILIAKLVSTIIAVILTLKKMHSCFLRQMALMKIHMILTETEMGRHVTGILNVL